VVTDSIIASLENGVKPWACPWDLQGCSDMPYSFKSKAQYSGINILLLWASATEQAHKCAAWLTYKQATEMGGQVRKGEKGTQIIFYKQFNKKDQETEEEKMIPVMKTYTVFNIDQIDGIEETPRAHNDSSEPLDFSDYVHVDDAIKATGAKITEMGAKAFYRPSTDEIYVPPRDRFNSVADFYATTLHELTHWTGGKARLDRVKGKRFGDDAYAFEELVAELGSAFLMADFCIDGEVQHERYIADWLTALKNDKKFIFQAASFASKAHKYIVNPQ
jgi:antirestriction protein ArdC